MIRALLPSDGKVMNEQDLPADFVQSIPEGTEAVARHWWSSLSAADRDTIARLWDNRLEISFFAPQADDSGCVDAWEQIPAIQGGRFIPPDDDGRGEWMEGYFEHLLQHPELVIAYDPTQRAFHFGCTAESQARACIAVGRVPGSFHCPARSTTCPFERLRGAALTRRATVRGPDPADSCQRNLR